MLFSFGFKTVPTVARGAYYNNDLLSIVCVIYTLS